ncbi:MAG: hypothetical protein E7468_06995 [Ruminococcaceae bacterium]|nr:hypothetical protein [Oscillospiraceae bacterium]
MKKIIAMLLAMAMLLCFAACETPNIPDTPDNTEPVQDSFTFTYKGTKIALHAPAADVVAALGEPKTYSESTSCAFEGLDKSYGYGSFYLETYPIGDKDYVYGWYFVDDMVENDEGICIGSSKADVEAAYGAENYNGTNAFEVTKGSGKLTIILENDVVSSVQYVIITE